MKRRNVFKKGLAHVSGGQITETLPKAPISKIIITGTHTSCTGTYVEDCVIAWVKVRINGKLFIDLSGKFTTAVEPWILALWNEFYKQKHHVAQPADDIIIELPDALPADAQVDLIIKWAGYLDAGCSGDDMVHSIDITYELDDKIKGKVVVPYIISDFWDFAATSGHKINYIPALPYPLRAVVFSINDNGTYSATPKADIDELIISTPLKQIFDGDMAELKAQQEMRSKHALTAGFWIVVFEGGLKVAPNTLKFDFYISSAGTDVEVNLLYICY